MQLVMQRGITPLPYKGTKIYIKEFTRNTENKITGQTFGA